jgi:hypothetical protein
MLIKCSVKYSDPDVGGGEGGVPPLPHIPTRYHKSVVRLLKRQNTSLFNQILKSLYSMQLN